MDVTTPDKPAQDATRSGRIGRLTTRDVAALMVQLSDLLDAGCSLARALEAVARQAGDSPLGALAGRLHGEIVAGRSLAEAMGSLRAHFSEVQIAMVRAAETGGFLQQTLSNLAQHASQQVAAARQIRGKLAYPGVLAITAVASVVFLLTFVVPRFTEIYRTAEQNLPGPTQLLLAVSGFIAGYWVWLLVAVVALALAVRAMFRWPAFRSRWDAAVLRAPVVGRVLRDWEMSRFAGTMALLLTGGAAVLSSLRMAAGVLANSALRREVEALARAVESGEPLSGTMKGSRFFDATAIEMIVVSEATGRLAGAMDRLSHQRRRDFQLRVDTLLSLVEPVIILLIGLVVGLTVVALLLPVLMMNTLVGG
ncbi:MAG: type II secretion system F family protein [Phycisphaerae bacterium]|nr:type II secretion system F family protein [Phycisphaerae bacterium]